MKTRDAVLLAIALLALAGAGVIFARWLRQNDAADEDFPEGTFWVCLDCGAEFTKSVRELAEFHSQHPDTELPCPKCGQANTVRAMRCPNCGRFFPRPPRGPLAPACPHCKQPIPRKTSSGR